MFIWEIYVLKLIFIQSVVICKSLALFEGIARWTVHRTWRLLTVLNRVKIANLADFLADDYQYISELELSVRLTLDVCLE